MNFTAVLECLFDLTQLPNRTITKTWWFLIQYTFKVSDIFYFVLQCGFRLPSTCVLVITITFFFFCSLNLYVYYDLPFSSHTVSVKSGVFNVKLINWTSLSCMLLAFVFYLWNTCVTSCHEDFLLFGWCCFLFSRCFIVLLYALRFAIYFLLTLAYIWGKVKVHFKIFLLAYNIRLVSGIQHTDLVYVYIVKSLLQ